MEYRNNKECKIMYNTFCYMAHAQIPMMNGKSSRLRMIFIKNITTHNDKKNVSRSVCIVKWSVSN